MYQARFYTKIEKDKITAEVEKEGFEPVCITDPPGRLYEAHKHPETKLLVVLEGTMEVQVKDVNFNCSPGDKLIIPGNTEHSAQAGPDGCTFLWSEKLSGE